jgi:hypothetical protein
MAGNRSSFTVFFEEPFWVGVYEREADGRYEVCKITFGAEPKDYEIYAYLLASWPQLPFGRPQRAAASAAKAPCNPKRMQRSIRHQLSATGVGTKAQQALKAIQEQNKQERRTVSRIARETESERRFALHEEKCREKHKGH